MRFTDVVSTPRVSSKRRFPRYFGDIETPHLDTPKRRRRVLEIARETVQKLTVQKEQLQRENKKLGRKIVTLEKALEDLQQKCMLSQQETDSIRVGYLGFTHVACM